MVHYNNRPKMILIPILKRLNVAFILLFVLFLTSCSEKQGIKLENGDILFVSANKGSLSSAIDRVTQTKQSTHYSHIGILEKSDTDYWVLHAGTRNGSERIRLDSFLLYAKQDSNHVDAYRLKNEYKKDIPIAIKTAKNWLGKPYNYSYILSNEKLYCSDFVQRSFAQDSVFKLEPMTFINPKTGKIDASWIAFYKKQGVEVPEGKPGCNPNNMAASSKIEKIGTIEN